VCASARSEVVEMNRLIGLVVLGVVGGAGVTAELLRFCVSLIMQDIFSAGCWVLGALPGLVGWLVATQVGCLVDCDAWLIGSPYICVVLGNMVAKLVGVVALHNLVSWLVG
jgi:hypothetical protein